MTHSTVTVLGAIILGSAAAQGALMISASATPPTSALISQTDFSATGLDSGMDFSDNGGPPGQSFTTGALPFTLDAIVVKGFENDGNSFGSFFNTTWTISVSTLNLGVLTQVDQEVSGTFTPTNGSDYLTFTFETPVALSASTVYAYDIYTSEGYFGFAKSQTDVYAGGQALQHGSTQRTSLSGANAINLQNVDRTFFIQGTAIPEPTSALLLSGGLVFLGLVRRRKA